MTSALQVYIPESTAAVGTVKKIVALYVSTPSKLVMRLGKAVDPVGKSYTIVTVPSGDGITASQTTWKRLSSNGASEFSDLIKRPIIHNKSQKFFYNYVMIIMVSCFRKAASCVPAISIL